MAIFNLQSNMNRGELDPRVVGRKDIDAYYNGVQLARNVLCTPQGGMRKRPGMAFLGAAIGDGRIENFSFSTEQNYLVVFTDLRMQVYKDGQIVVASRAITGATQANPVVVTSTDHGFLDGQTVSIAGVGGMIEINNRSFTVANATTNTFELQGEDGTGHTAYTTGGAASAEVLLVTPWTLLQLADFDYIQSADTAIIVHPDVEPRTVARTSDADWEITSWGATNLPQFDFDDASSPTPVAEVQDITFTASGVGDRYKLGLEGLLTEELIIASGTTTNADNIRRGLQDVIQRGGSGVTVSFTGGTTYRITLGNEAAKDWKLITGTPILSEDVAFEISTVRIAAGTSRKEDVWSVTRGWPRTATFHEARLWLGGSKSRPSTIWGSRTNDFFNFDEGRGRADELVAATLDTDQVNAIQGIFSNRALQIFTTGGEFYSPESPITPENISVTPQTNLGSLRIRPVSIDGVTLFAQRSGKSVNQFQFVNEFQANQTRSISVLAPHLINTPVEMAVSKGSATTDANYVYILNSDGNLTVFNTLISEDVQGFTTWETDGGIQSVAVVDDTLYFLVKRTVNTATVYYVEREDDMLNTDAGVLTNVGGSDTLTGLDHLESETIAIKADGSVQADEIVSGGQIVIGRTAQTIEAGFLYIPTIKTLPLNIQLGNGPNAYARKKIQRASLQLYESNGVIVNDQRIADKTIGQDQFDAPIPRTGISRIYLPGWSLDATLEITQKTPMPMTVLAIGLEVAT